MVLSLIVQRSLSIQECIGIKGVANASSRGPFELVDILPILEMITVDRVNVASGAGGSFDWSSADCGVVGCSVICICSGSGAGESGEVGRCGSSCLFGRAVVIVIVDGVKSRSSFSMFSRICCRMAARSTGSLLGSSVAVRDSVGATGLGSG